MRSVLISISPSNLFLFRNMLLPMKFHSNGRVAVRVLCVTSYYMELLGCLEL